MTSAAAVPRLLWVNHFAVTPDMGGGTRHAEMGRELARLGWRVTIAASDFHLHRRAYTRRPGVAHREPVVERVDGVEFRWLWAAPYTANDHRRVRNWLSFGRSLLRAPLGPEPPDVVVGSSPHLFAALAAYRLARRVRRPFVLEVRDLWPETLRVASRRRGPGYWTLWSLARFLYRSADRIIVLAEGARDYLARSGIDAARIALVPNGVDAAAFAAAEPPPRETLRLVYAGAHGPANGLDAILDAAALLRHEPRVSFLLVGDGPARPALRAAAHRLGLSNVTFADPVPKTAMPALLASCDAGLMVLAQAPVFAFGVSPNKLFDYWGAALPVVCNVPGEVAAYVAQAGGGVQTSGADGVALAGAVLELLGRSPAERRELGRRGREWVRRERDRPLLAARLDGALRPLAAVE